MVVLQFCIWQMLLSNIASHSRYTVYQFMHSLGIKHITLVLLALGMADIPVDTINW